jgi:uncharacterized membrane protein YcjF (UPF0283 family)
MSPASYLTAPPRVARKEYQSRGYDPFMPWWTWVALAFFLVAFVGGIAIAVMAFLRLRDLQDRAERMATAAEELGAKAVALEQRALTVEQNQARLEAHLSRLARSRERLDVLTWALRDATKDLTSFRSVLRK